MTDISERVRIEEIKVLSDNWYVLRKVTFSLSPQQRRMAEKRTRSL